VTIRVFSRRLWRAWLAAAAAGVLAVGSQWFGWLRVSLDRPGAELHVTTGADAGLGSLREAILAADRSPSRARIVFETRRVHVQTPLPPLVNPFGVVLDTNGSPSLIEADPGVGPILDIASPGSVVSRIQIAGADREAILLRSSGARVTNVRIERCATGVYLAAGADELTVEQSEFADNDIGIQLTASTRRVRVFNNRFRRHRTAGVWAVAPAALPQTGTDSLSVHDNRFEDDSQSLIVMNINARIERNTIAGAGVSAMLIDGASTVVHANRVRAGIGFGISANRLVRGLISENEIDHNCAGGIMVRNAERTDIASNRLYANGYGIVMVMGAQASPNSVSDNLVARQFEDGLYIIGSSPVVRRNRVLDNRRAGLRIASLPTEGNRTIESDPLLISNVLIGNEYDALHDVYRPLSIGLTQPGLTDCAWRRGGEARASSAP
jgi:parallel beta helix pectate lyase-like protein